MYIISMLLCIIVCSCFCFKSAAPQEVAPLSPRDVSAKLSFSTCIYS